MFEPGTAKVGVTPDGVALLEVIRRHPATGEEYHCAIPLEAIASWSELLGYDNAVDALEAIMTVAENGEPDPDPETGDNCWTEAYVALGIREQARERAAFAALREGKEHNPQSALLRSSLAANKAANSSDMAARASRGEDVANVPMGVRDDILNAVQSEACRRLGVPRFAQNQKAARGGTVGRKGSASLGQESEPLGPGHASPEEREELAAALRGKEGEIGRLRRDFCHRLSGFETDPLEGLEAELDVATIEEPLKREATTRESLVAKYGGGGGAGLNKAA